MKRYIVLNASTKDPQQFIELDAIFTQDVGTYYCSLTNPQIISNFYTIEFVDRFVYPSGYIINSAPCGYLKSWMLEGSLDGKEWELLHSKYNTEDLSTDYKWYRIN